MENSAELAEGQGALATKKSGSGLARASRVDWRSGMLLVAILVLATALRLWAIKSDAQNPFYDAAVRSMGLSWHNFFFGALDPSARLAIDKPPVDLWLQVASTKLLGFNRTALALPEAIGGIAAVALLYGAVRCACGGLAGALAALALAVLPLAVVTSRSDTMDSVMSALLIAALWSSVVAVRSRRARYVMLSAALVGLAFDVKLAQALVGLPALALMWWAASRVGRRVSFVVSAATVLVVVAMAWAFTASLTPLSERPFPMGSHTGSIYRAMFVFNGIERLTGASREIARFGFSSSPGLGRLFGLGQPHYGALIGLELVATFAFSIAVLVLWLLNGDPDRGYSQAATRTAGEWRTAVRITVISNWLALAGGRTVRWLVATLIAWLVTGYVLFSFMGRLQPRYLEAMSPAVAAALGIATAYLLVYADKPRGAWLCAAGLTINAAFAVHVSGVSDNGVQVCLLATLAAFACLGATQLRRARVATRTASMLRLRMGLFAVVSLALLAAPAEASIDLVEERASDANPTGSGSQYSAYLRAHRDGARYEAAATNPLAVVGLIAQDGQPVLVLRSVDGVLVSVRELRRLVSERALRFVIISHPCVSTRHCTPTTVWSMRNSVMVRPGLYRYVSPRRLR